MILNLPRSIDITIKLDSVKSVVTTSATTASPAHALCIREQVQREKYVLRMSCCDIEHVSIRVVRQFMRSFQGWYALLFDIRSTLVLTFISMIHSEIEVC